MSTFTPDNTTPGVVALSRVNDVVTSAKIVPIEAGATLLRVCAISKDILIHWATVDTDYCTLDNFDDVVAVATTQDIAIPGDKTFVSFLSQASGGTAVVVQK